MPAHPQLTQQSWMALVNSGNIVYTSYPTAVSPLANVTGVQLAADAAGSKYGATVEILAATPAVCWVCGISINTASAIDQYMVRLSVGAGDGAIIAESGIIDLTAATANVPPIWFPYPIRLAAAVRIGGRLACLDAVARTLNVSVTLATNVGA